MLVIPSTAGAFQPLKFSNNRRTILSNKKSADPFRSFPLFVASSDEDGQENKDVPAKKRGLLKFAVKRTATPLRRLPV